MKLQTTSLLLLLTICVYGQDGWTPEKIMEYGVITDTEISPNGKYTAYVVRSPLMEGEKSEYNSQIWVAANDGTFNFQYTRGEKSSTSPKFSPDGQHLAFVSSRNERNQVFVMRVMGGEPEQITDGEKGISNFKWSPDGASIAYIMQEPDSEEEKKKKKEKRDVILVDQNYKYNHLYRTSVGKNHEGKRETKQLVGGKMHVGAFDWSPDGTTIAFSHAPNPTINDGGSQIDISTVPSDSGAVKALVTRDGADRDPHYSPDGSWIAFESHGGQPERVGLSDVYKIPATGGKSVALQQSPDRNANIIAWDPSGDHLYVAEANKTSRVLMALPTDKKSPALGGDQVTITDGGVAIITPSNAVSGGFSVSKSGHVSYISENMKTPEEVYVATTRGEGRKQVSTVNESFDPPAMGKSEVIRWKSSDGLEIEGLLTYPVDYEQGKKYPIVLQIHGGPAGVFTQSYTGAPSIYMTQYFAQNGYIVLRPNPRGSAGYGKDFRYANIQDWGYGDYQDLMTGVDHVLSMGIADKDKQFVMGWSYGGYMTSWVVTQTDRFKAASMGAGLPNLVSMVTTTDIPDYLVAHMGGKEYWEDYAAYEKHSAIYHIGNVVTPTQVIHGANDLRVPFTQGQEFYVSLKRKGVDTEMVVYPRTPHGPREPKFLMDVSPRILKWFERYR